MTTFVSRASWGARAPRNVSNNITPQNGGVTVHYVGSGNVARPDHSQCAAQVRGIQNGHMDGNGWADIAYTHLVCVHDYVFHGRGPNVRTAANGTNPGNQNWYGVCALIGDADTVPAGLTAGIRSAIANLRSVGNAANGINGHRDHLATSCPGSRLYALVQDGSLNPGGGGGPSPAPAWPGVYFRYPPVTTHSSVRTWQQQMLNRGWSLAVDGAYGAGSREVCLAFQREKGLGADGVVGPATWAAAWTAPLTRVEALTRQTLAASS
ncbi:MULTISPECIES: N-acetylmuramoyl-L-alanine amidase [Actinoalloteichus]|uniref:N-acetylmuramoyl-L-alanine amidase n=1 Tax=Actinoalloteichus fjordicus TaxID=1612552 RepID=A0AAC9LB45_9PSEU|nr:MULTISPECIES: peptidoglycan-binding domain-containing protein [Actinoalloteichus]APU13674.1 N-acetylmuramoyl-L-alanine amidase [Actinoalloteichus fjordicus]APU19620.1 N-acetylmuramoyl-L-alanine amidase [Actinoalloteichus sp. GBA129-24]